jgi:hypothetical protein
MLVFCVGPIKATQSQNGLEQRQAKLTQGKNECEQQAGALIGVKGKNS